MGVTASIDEKALDILIMCEFNKRSKFQPSLNDCDICKRMYHMPHNYCCLEECGEHEFCINCAHGIYQNESEV